MLTKNPHPLHLWRHTSPITKRSFQSRLPEVVPPNRQPWRRIWRNHEKVRSPPNTGRTPPAAPNVCSPVLPCCQHSPVLYTKQCHVAAVEANVSNPESEPTRLIPGRSKHDIVFPWLPLPHNPLVLFATRSAHSAHLRLLIVCRCY